MDKGFYHPDRGYWQAVGGNPSLFDYPEGTLEVPLKPSADHHWQNGEWVYVEPQQPTPEELLAQMPDKTPREFRDILIDDGVLTDTVPDEVTVAIQQIPFDKERAKALNAWQNPTMFSRSDPYIDMIGAMFGYTPEDIDILWMGNE